MSRACRRRSSPPARHAVSKACRERFASSGEIAPPCGVPRRVRWPPWTSRLPSGRSSTTGCAQPLPEQPTDGSVAHPAGHGREEVLVGDGVDGGRQVGVEHLRVAPREGVGDLLHGLVGALLRADTGGARLEVRLEDRLQHQANGGLDHPVPDRRDAEGPLPSTPLGDEDPPDGGGPVGGRPEFLGEMREERGDPVRRSGCQRDAIHAGRAPLGAHQGPGVTQEVGPGDLVIAEGEPEGRLRLGLAGPASAGGPARALEVRASRQSSRELPVGSAVKVRPLPSAEVVLSSAYERYAEPLRLPARPPAVSAWALSARVAPLWPTEQALPWCPVKLSPPVTPATPEGVVWLGRCGNQSTNGLPPPSTGSAPSDVP